MQTKNGDKLLRKYTANMLEASRKEKELYRKFTKAKSLNQAEEIADKMKMLHQEWASNQEKINNLVRIEQSFGNKPKPIPFEQVAKYLNPVPRLKPHPLESTPPKLVELISEQMGIDPDRVNLDATLRKDLGADDLDMVELVMMIEEDFDMEISDEQAETFTTVKDIHTFLKLQGKL